MKLFLAFVVFCGACCVAEKPEAASIWNTKIVHCNLVGHSSDQKYSYQCTPHNISCDIDFAIFSNQDNDITNHFFDCYTPIAEKFSCHILNKPSSTPLTPILECEPEVSEKLFNHHDVFFNRLAFLSVILTIFAIYIRCYLRCNGDENPEEQRDSDIEFHYIRAESK